MDDAVKGLIGKVARGFYSIPYILVLDAVLVHSVLLEEDLVYLLNIKRKELRSLCNKLVEDRLLLQHVQKEENQQQRLATRTYYYIHATEAIDSVKWKVHAIVNRIQQEMTEYGNPQGYVCPRCGKKVSQLDAISMLSDDRSRFVCDTCGGELVVDDSSKQASLRQAKLERLMYQIEPIIYYLKMIDDSTIEDNSFESSLEKSIPAQTTTEGAYSLSNRVVTLSSNASQPSQNDTSKAHTATQVSITANDEMYEREQQAKEERRKKLQQNALPSWHFAASVGASNLGQTSGNGKSDTVSEQEIPDISVKSENEQSDDRKSPSLSLMDTTLEVSGAPQPEPLPVDEHELKDKEAQDALAAYYAQLGQKGSDNEENDEEDDDEELDLEDLI